MLLCSWLEFFGLNPRAYNPTCARRLDYAHAGFFMHVHATAQKP